jgi:hypothetical protein
VEAVVLIRFVLAFILAFVPAGAWAQSTTVSVPQWDIAATTGLFAGYHPRVAGGRGYQEEWFHSVQGGVTVGRYLTRHLKLEVEASIGSPGTLFRERSVAIPNSPYPYSIGSDVSTSVRSLGAALTWQFRDNEWAHPFVQAGVSADVDRVTVRTWEDFLFDTPPGAPPQRVIEERVAGPATTREIRGVVGGGAKVYVTPRVFVRPDGRWTFGRERHNVALRLGVGVDF